MSSSLAEDEGPNAKKPRERHNCCVPQCTNVKKGEIHLHKVPADAATRDKWRLLIKTGKQLGSTMKVCSEHFKKEDYIISSEYQNRMSGKISKRVMLSWVKLPFVVF